MRNNPFVAHSSRKITVTLLHRFLVKALMFFFLHVPAVQIDPVRVVQGDSAESQVAQYALTKLIERRPKVGVRLGVGSDRLVSGLDVTFRAPSLGLPVMRVDLDSWSESVGGVFSDDGSGGALSALVMQDVGPAYVGVGPSFIRSYGPDRADRLGLKAAAGIQLSRSFFLEASTTIGGEDNVAFFMVGFRF
jgi:hypothetical protein